MYDNDEILDDVRESTITENSLNISNNGLINNIYDPWLELNIVNHDILEPFASWLQWWFCNDTHTAMAQVILALVWGILLSPWSSGLFFLVIFIIFYEILYYIFTKGNPRYYNVFVRTGVIHASIFGYILGRTVSGDNILNEGVP